MTATHTATYLGDARIIRSEELVFQPQEGSRTTVATPVSPEAGATWVTLHVARIAPGETWSPPHTLQEENTAVVFAGSGRLTVDDDSRPARPASAAYAPTGRALALTADDAGMTVYVWRSPLQQGRRLGTDPKFFSSLWDETTRLQGFAGTGQVSAEGRRAAMNFVFWPGSGSCQLCLHCGIQEPGETFNVHLHPDSDEAFIAFEGVGQMYLVDRWVDVAAGDVLYAAPGVLHGARNPHTGPEARRFVTCGGPTPFDPALYDAAGVSSEVI
ncbi:cupin domain-containing protein [Streptomyces sp. NPDC008222]|uniref:cupin domain-containing protein n=1 Tax=Streptomyces sp. NPDC008222 TaxID=3364820 RepID=UPI0036E1C0BA